jgi:anti-anti-sigma factor
MSDDTFHITSSMPAPGVLVLGVVGELDADTSDQLLNEFDRWLGLTELIVDLHDCTFIDSRGMAALVECRRQIGPDATIKLLRVAPDIEHRLRIAGLETTLGLDAIA